MFLLFLCCVSSWFKHKKIAFHVLFFIMGILENRKIKAASKLGQYSVSGLLLSGEVAFCLKLRRGEKLEWNSAVCVIVIKDITSELLWLPTTAAACGGSQLFIRPSANINLDKVSTAHVHVSKTRFSALIPFSTAQWLREFVEESVGAWIN